MEKKIQRVTVQEMDKLGTKLRANYNGLLALHREAKTDKAKKALEDMLADIEEILIRNGFVYRVTTTKENKVYRINEIIYDPGSKYGMGHGRLSFNKKDLRRLIKEEIVENIQDSIQENIECFKDKFIYIDTQQFPEFKEKSLLGMEPYIGTKEDFTYNSYYNEFKEDSFVGIIIESANNNKYLRVRAKSSFKNYSGYEDYIILNNDIVRNNIYKNIDDINFEYFEHKGRARYLANFRLHDDDFYNLNVYGNMYKSVRYLSEFRSKVHEE